MGVILLVRHGRASFGSDDYDRLSEQGFEQSRLTGAALARQQVRPRAILAGRPRRHLETAEAMRVGAGWESEIEIDPTWDEIDVHSFMQQRADGESASDSAAFQVLLEAGIRDWVAGRAGSGGESFDEFVERVDSGLRQLGEAGGTAVIASSAGTISWVATRLLGGGVEEWLRLNRVCVNASITKVVVGRAGQPALTSYNEHGHLVPDHLNYR